jgi:hypothetical protein
MQYLELGPVPAGESCAQVGSDGYDARAQRECAVYKRMLQRLFPVPDGLGVRYAVRRHPHDFGAYFEVSVGYDVGGAAAEASCEFAFNVERCTPELWDPIARYELMWFERHEKPKTTVGHAGAEPPPLPAGPSLQELLAAHPL